METVSRMGDSGGKREVASPLNRFGTPSPHPAAVL